MDLHKRKSDRPAKKHHYLSVAYLAGFTPSGSKKDYLQILDLKKRETRRGRPEKVGYQNNFYTVGVYEESDTVEELLAREESRVLPVVKSVCEKKRFSVDEQDQLLRFMALTSVRLPRFREYLERCVERKSGKPFEETLRDLDAWRWRSEWREVPLDRVINILEYPATHQDYYAQAWHVWSIDPMSGLLLDLLKKKVWSLYIARPSCPFICSEHPVGMAFPPGYISSEEEKPTLGNPAAVLTFPLDRHTALVGGLHDSCRVVYMSDSNIAAINWQTILLRERFVFAPSLDFLFAVPGGTIQKGEALFGLVKPSAA
jgi:hypothetical protein